MDCSEFLASFSEYYDAAPGSPERREGERHVASCDSCKRYVHVVDRGVSLLRSMPAPEPAPNFFRRLEHRLLHVMDGDDESRHGSSSALPMATVLGMAILLTVIAWSPALRDATPEVRLDPIVVSDPPAERGFYSGPPTFLLEGEATPLRFGEELFDDPTSLFYQYSPLGAKYRNGRYLRRAGLR